MLRILTKLSTENRRRLNGCHRSLFTHNSGIQPCSLVKFEIKPSSIVKFQIKPSSLSKITINNENNNKYYNFIKNFYQKPIVIKVMKILAGQLIFVMAAGGIIHFIDPSEHENGNDDVTITFGNVAGIVEEFIYRNPLVSTYRISILPFLLSTWVGSLLGKSQDANQTASECRIRKTVNIIQDIALISGISHFLFKNTKLNKLTHPLLICSTILSFGLMHLYNFKEVHSNNEIHPKIITLVVVYQTVGGALLTFTALKYGLRYSILYHCAFNTVVISLGNMMKLLETPSPN